MIRVHVVGTPMWFSISSDKLRFYSSRTRNQKEEYYYCVGEITHHPSLGPLRCEEVSIDDEGKVSHVIVSVQPHRLGVR